MDQLRGIAALAVVIGHARGLLYVGGTRLKALTPIENWTISDKAYMGLLSLTRLSPEFVIFFFLLSGFSIAHSLRASESTIGFYARRFIRLYPTYIVALLWASLVFIVTRRYCPDFYSGTYEHVTFDELAASRDFLSPRVVLQNLLYIPKGLFVKPFWSLSHEVIFYILAPVFLAQFRPYFIISFVLYIFAWPNNHFSWVETSVLLQFATEYNFYFALGIASYQNWGRLKSALHFPTPVVAGLVAVIFFSAIALGLFFGSISRASSLAFAFGSVLLMVNLHTHGWKSRHLRILGDLSYSLYATHFASLLLLLAIIHSFIPPPYIFSRLAWLTGPPFALSIAWLAYHAVELPSKRLLTRLRERRPIQPASYATE